jgi:hypothetical protein
VTNAFLAALLKVAAEERLREERLRVLASSWNPEDRSPFGQFTRWCIADCHAKADEHAGRAEVYEGFAHRLIADAASELILEQAEKLVGEAYVFGGIEDPKEIPFEFTPPYEGFRTYWTSFVIGRLTTPQPSIITGLF